MKNVTLDALIPREDFEIIAILVEINRLFQLRISHLILSFFQH